jgi:hypothetical protein
MIRQTKWGGKQAGFGTGFGDRRSALYSSAYNWHKTTHLRYMSNWLPGTLGGRPGSPGSLCRKVTESKQSRPALPGRFMGEAVLCYRQWTKRRWIRGEHRPPSGRTLRPEMQIYTCPSSLSSLEADTQHGEYSYCSPNHCVLWLWPSKAAWVFCFFWSPWRGARALDRWVQWQCPLR